MCVFFFFSKVVKSGCRLCLDSVLGIQAYMFTKCPKNIRNWAYKNKEILTSSAKQMRNWNSITP